LTVVNLRATGRMSRDPAAHDTPFEEFFRRFGEGHS
jgi:hypothetical protein